MILRPIFQALHCTCAKHNTENMRFTIWSDRKNNWTVRTEQANYRKSFVTVWHHPHHSPLLKFLHMMMGWEFMSGQVRDKDGSMQRLRVSLCDSSPKEEKQKKSHWCARLWLCESWIYVVCKEWGQIVSLTGRWSRYTVYHIM